MYVVLRLKIISIFSNYDLKRLKIHTIPRTVIPNEVVNLKLS